MNIFNDRFKSKFLILNLLRCVSHSSNLKNLYGNILLYKTQMYSYIMGKNIQEVWLLESVISYKNFNFKQDQQNYQKITLKQTVDQIYKS